MSIENDVEIHLSIWSIRVCLAGGKGVADNLSIEDRKSSPRTNEMGTVWTK
jgi:hypothetical protein